MCVYVCCVTSFNSVTVRLPWMDDIRAMQDAYMDVSGRTTQETKSSNCRGTVIETTVIL